MFCLQKLCLGGPLTLRIPGKRGKKIYIFADDSSEYILFNCRLCLRPILGTTLKIATRADGFNTI